MTGLRRTRLKGWLEFTREHCSICGKTGGCMINEKGDTIVCIRIESNIVFSKTFQSWVHKLSDTKEIKVIKNNVHERTKAPIWTLDKFFRLLNKELNLFDNHVVHLLEKRGMSTEEINIRQYKSFPKNTNQIATEMIDKIPHFDKLDLGIPGFYKKDGKWFINGGEGILVPYRNEENEIIGYQIRVDQVKNFVTVDNKHKSDFKAFVYKQPNIVRVVNEDGELILEKEFRLKEEMYIETKEGDESCSIKLQSGQRYYWLSSANKNEGCGAGDPAPYHVAVTSDKLNEWEVRKKNESTSTLLKTEAAWITEGAIKGDIAIEQLQKALGTNLKTFGDVVLAVPGVNSWRVLLPVIKRMEIKRINLAFDIDSMENELVARQLKDCIVEVKKMGIEVYLAVWNQKDGKGIDDVLLNRKMPVLKKL